MTPGRPDSESEPQDGEEKVIRLYTNHVSIAFSLSEVELQFGQVFGPGDLLVPHSWLVTSPIHLVSFGRAIALTILRYERRFGPIPVAAAPASDERQG